MKKFIILSKLGLLMGILAMIVISCNQDYAGSTEIQYAQPTTTLDPTFTASLLEPVSPNDAVWEMLGQVNLDRAENDLKRLTGEEPVCIATECYTISSRQTGSEGLRWAKNYIYKEILNLGYSAEFQDWSNSGKEDQNLIARKPGVLHPEEEIYFIAHLDGKDPGFLSLKRPAADDNGSGVVDLLEMARVLSSHTFERTLVLIFSTGEEQGTLGIKGFLEQLSADELNAIQYAVNIDMVGYDANNDRVMELWHGGHSPSIALTKAISQTIQAYQLDLSPGFVVGCG